VATSHDLIVTELSTHLQGQRIAVHPAYNETFEAFVPGNKGQAEGTYQIWVVGQMLLDHCVSAQERHVEADFMRVR
jgi:hypothetical protein